LALPLPEIGSSSSGDHDACGKGIRSSLVGSRFSAHAFGQALDRINR